MHVDIRRVILGLLALVGLSAADGYGQVSNNVTLLGTLDEYSEYNDIWGYTDEFGNEYALVGTTTGTTVVNVTNPAIAYETGFIAGEQSIWRDMKTYGDYAYVVSEGGGGMQIIDLADPENPSLAGAYGTFSAHNIYIEEATARAYPCGVSGAQGFLVLDLSDPIAPSLLGSYTASYVHDLYVRDNIAYIAEINNASFSILDVNNPAATVLIGGPVTYPTAFTHNAWLTDDGNYLLTTDENVGGHVRIWDVQNLLDIQQVGEYQAPVTNSIIHNVLVRGDLAYVSYYTEGVRVVDISNPTAPAEFGYYDTWPGASGGFNGAWGVYALFPSGRFVANDISTGLYVLQVESGLAKVAGTVVEDGVGTPLDGVLVEIVESALSTQTSPAGTYTIFSAPGMVTLRATKEGFFDHQETVVLDECCPLTADVSLVRRPNATLSGTVLGNDNSKALVALEGASIALLGTSQSTATDANGLYSLPLVPVGTYTMRVVRPGYGFTEVIVTVTVGGTVRDVTLEPSPWYDNADTDRGWSLGDPADDATTGVWIRAIPVPSGSGQVQPGMDASPGPSAGVCFVTGNAVSEFDNVGANDIDGGITTLTTPTLDMSAIADPYLAYSRWYVNTAGANPGTDLFVTQISNDDGGSWSDLQTLTIDATPWTRVIFRVADFVTPTDQMKVRFIGADTGGGSVVEVAIDDFEFFGLTATATDPAPPVALPAVRLAAYPNPFNPRTTVQFELPRSQKVRLTIHDLRGRVVTTLTDETRASGEHRELWDGRDATGRPVASGAYLAVLRTEDGTSSHKLLLAK